MTNAALLAVFMTVLVPGTVVAAPPTNDITDSFRDAGAAVNSLQVYEIAGIVIIRGRTAEKAQAELLSRHAYALGYNRVANLVQIVEHDDKLIARKAEVELSVHRSLDGCRFRVSSAQGIVHVGGQVSHELQKDVALQVLRSIDGVRGVQMELTKF